MGLLDDDELVEVKPQAIRMRKKLLKERERKRTSRAAVSWKRGNGPQETRRSPAARSPAARA